LQTSANERGAAATEFNRGASWVARSLCSAARKAWPEFVASLNLEQLPVELRISTRGLLAALMLHLLESWLAEHTDVTDLPPIDWASFAPHAEEVGNEARDLIGEWRRAV
jgi:hypothetical protein